MSTEPSQADIMAAFQAGAYRSKAPAATSVLADINDPNPVGALTQPAEGEAEGSKSKTNSRKIYCFREGCGSVILQKGAATYIESPANIVRPHPNPLPFLSQIRRLMFRYQMTKHPLFPIPSPSPPTLGTTRTGTSLIHMHSTISVSPDPTLRQISLSRPTYLGERGWRGK